MNKPVHMMLKALLLSYALDSCDYLDSAEPTILCLNENGLFCQSLRQIKILILEILNVCLRLKFLFSLTLTKNPHFRSGTILL